MVNLIRKNIPVPETLPPARRGLISYEVGDCVLYATSASACSRRSTLRRLHPEHGYVWAKLADDALPGEPNRYGVWRVK